MSPFPPLANLSHSDTRVRSLGSQLDSILLLTLAMIRNGRPVQMNGLDDQVGQLCAACLDMPPNVGFQFRISLQKTLRLIDELREELRFISSATTRQKALLCQSVTTISS